MVSVFFKYLEPLSSSEPPTVQIARRSEVFDEGRPSRVLLTTARSLALPELASMGLSGLWKEEIAAGVQEIENALASERRQI